ncbi:hypothetical protein C8R43DRAFT_960069 [Mycena crocata]|nr:hypothetical protein C8R43DRAFT_960069 [Mycena crocata]
MFSFILAVAWSTVRIFSTTFRYVHDKKANTNGSADSAPPRALEFEQTGAKHSAAKQAFVYLWLHGRTTQITSLFALTSYLVLTSSLALTSLFALTSSLALTSLFEVDDGDSEWEDVNGAQLAGLGNTTHRSRHRDKPVIPMRKHRRRDAGTNSRASARKRKEVKEDKYGALAKDIKIWELEREERVHELAVKHSIKAHEVRRRMLASSTFKPARKPSLYNAKISRIMADLNEGRELGDRYKIPAIKRMVAEDPSMLDNFTEEEEEEMLRNLEEKRAVKHHGARATNKAAKEDARQTMERLAKEIMALAERCGMMGFAFFTRGHIHDRTVPVSIESWGAMRFVREMLKKEPSDVQSMFELWAVNQLRGDTGSLTLQELQKECTQIITSGYLAIINATKGAMNYQNYIKAVVVKKGYGIVNWPKETPFKRMSLQSSIGPAPWKKLTPDEKTRILAQFEDMVEKGEYVEKVRKTSEKRKKSSKGKGKAVEEEDESDEEGDEEEEEDEGPRKPIAGMSMEERRKRLQRLARKTAARHENEGDDVEDRAPPKSAKRKAAAVDDDDVNDERPAKKVSRKKDGGGKERALRKLGKRKARVESEDEEEPRSRKKAKRGTAKTAVQPTQKPAKAGCSRVGPTQAYSRLGTPRKGGRSPRLRGRSSGAGSATPTATAPPASPPPASPSASPPAASPPRSRTDPTSPPRAVSPTTPAPTGSVVPDSEPPSSRGGTVAWVGAAMPPPSGVPHRSQVGDGEVVPDSETSGSRATTVVPPAKKKKIVGPRGAPPGKRAERPA